MLDVKDISWFKATMASKFIGYDLVYRYYAEGDFGSLDQVIIESTEKGGQVDFWGLGWLGISAYDYKRDQDLMNILLEPQEHAEKEKAFEKLLKVL